MQRVSLLAILPLVLVACFNPSMQIDARTALEQQLTRTAILRTVDRLEVPNEVLSGTWRIEVLAPDRQDESWIRGSLRRRLAALGVNVSTDESAPLPVVEARTAYAGSDIDNFYVGIPIPGSGGHAFSFYQSITERGRARIGLTFWSADGKLVGQTPSVDASAHFKDVFVLTIIGPFSFSDVEHVEVQRILETGVDSVHGVETTREHVIPGAKEEPGDQ